MLKKIVNTVTRNSTDLRVTIPVGALVVVALMLVAWLLISLTGALVNYVNLLAGGELLFWKYLMALATKNPGNFEIGINFWFVVATLLGLVGVVLMAMANVGSKVISKIRGDCKGAIS